jgi:hypothetical protein
VTPIMIGDPAVKGLLTWPNEILYHCSNLTVTVSAKDADLAAANTGVHGNVVLGGTWYAR